MTRTREESSSHRARFARALPSDAPCATLCRSLAGRAPTLARLCSFAVGLRATPLSCARASRGLEPRSPLEYSLNVRWLRCPLWGSLCRGGPRPALSGLRPLRALRARFAPAPFGRCPRYARAGRVLRPRALRNASGGRYQRDCGSLPP